MLARLRRKLLNFNPSLVRFTRKSQNDKYPTLTQARLASAFEGVNLDKVTSLTLSVASQSNPSLTYQVTFRKNRIGVGATFIAVDWPKGLRRPSVGRAISYLVSFS
jgi:hypothetical protein